MVQWVKDLVLSLQQLGEGLSLTREPRHAVGVAKKKKEKKKKKKE